MSRLTQKVFGIAVTNKAWPVENVQSLSEFNTFKGFLMGEAVEKLARYEDLGEPEELQRKSECENIYDVWANPTVNFAARLEKQSEELVKISGYSVEDLIGKFKQGYTLVITNAKPLPEPPKECENDGK